MLNNLVYRVFILKIFLTTPFSDDAVFFGKMYDLFNSNFIAIALIGITSVILELRLREKFDKENKKHKISSFHQTAVFIILVFGFGFYLLGLLGCFNYLYIWSDGWLLLATILITALFFFTCLRDDKTKFIMQSIYLLSLLTALMIHIKFAPLPYKILWKGTVILGLYALTTTLIWTQRKKLFITAERLKIPINKDENSGLDWLRKLNFVLVLIASITAAYVVLDFSQLSLRLIVAMIVIAQLFTFALLAKDENRQQWQRIALLLFSFGLSLFGCAWLTPNVNATWLNRSVVLMIVMFVLLGVFGFFEERLKDGFEDWLKSAQTIAPVWIVVSALSLLFVLLAEIAQQVQYGQVMIEPLAIIVVAITLLSASIVCVLFAANKESDPLNLTDKKRMIYVYVAEGLLALLLMHIRLSMAWLFSGFFEKYWTIFVVLLSFISVGLSEVLRRRNLITLSTPIERTGVFLPLLPVLGFWFVNSRVDYSIILFAIGVLYGVLSLMRRSFGFGLLAALAGNGGFWYVLHRTDNFGLLQHPQVWFIPFALSVLIATHLNRERFDENQMTTIRYISLMMVYVSSTADIFINGVAQSPWLPLVLMILSVAGVMCGIIFRIRAFLFLGTAFLIIAMVTMIYYASANLGWTWLWWVAGIFIGGVIIFTFALFEKKRQEMLRLLDEMRAWER